jgi:calcineurin-like phosphoesterase family protein
MIWFTSDWHLGHGRICELANRPFDDTRTMNHWLIESANRDTHPLDTLIFLGDAAMGTMAETLPLFKQVHCRLVLKPGNHDRCSPLYEGYTGKPPEKVAALVAEWTARYEEVGFEVTDHNSFSNNDYDVWMSHFPYEGDRTAEDRFVAARPKDKGEWLLHGHTHGLWRQRGKQIDVGVDAWAGRLVSQNMIAGMIHAGPGLLDALPWAA